MKRIILAALVGLLVSGSVWGKGADNLSGNYWFKICASTEVEDILYCLGFVSGLAEGQEFLEGVYIKVGKSYKKARSFCVPDTATLGQRRDIFVKYLRDHPGKRHKRASVLFGHATRKAFCK
jgi:hypothetical protein